MSVPAWDQPYLGEVDLFLERAGFDEDDLDAMRQEAYDASGELRKPTRSEAEDALSEYLVDRWLKGHVTAREVCTISFWASAAGTTGFVQTLAFRPDAPTGHYARHLETVLNLERLTQNQTKIEVPIYKKSACVRDSFSLPAVHSCV